MFITFSATLKQMTLSYSSCVTDHQYEFASLKTENILKINIEAS